MAKNNSRKISTPQSLNSYIKSICDIMRRSGRAGALQYVPELTWMLFLRILDEREEKIIRLRFGLDREGYPRTLEEVGQYFQLTRERIRQIEAKAVQKLKNSLRARKLKPFLEEVFGASAVK